MGKAIKYLLVGIFLSLLLVVGMGLYKFNYLSGRPGYDVDGNPILKQN